MGSKRVMLTNGLGELLHDVVGLGKDFHDLFCGTAAVASYVASNFPVRVCATDLQAYAVALAACQLEKVGQINADDLYASWQRSASAWLQSQHVETAAPCPTSDNIGAWRSFVRRTRIRCANAPEEFAITRAYGGYYYSEEQARALDVLRSSLPDSHRFTALAALISAASNCAAAPGHTAQPFGLSDSSLPHLRNAWRKDVASTVRFLLPQFAQKVALVAGTAYVADALSHTMRMREGDLAFIDPPYSEVQYSRFYHVLESVAKGVVGPVSGRGRYPPISDRPQSDFCRKSSSIDAFNDLMLGVAAAGAEAIVTFPAGTASNGLTGSIVEAISSQYFVVRQRKVSSVFSTLGGNVTMRAARKYATELLLHLSPRGAS